MDEQIINLKFNPQWKPDNLAGHRPRVLLESDPNLHFHPKPRMFILSEFFSAHV
jgi:hypothetical protein